MIFSRKQVQKSEDPGAKLINRIIMLGLVAFMAFSVLSEKKVLEKTKYVWQAEKTNLATGMVETAPLTADREVVLALDEKDVEKLKTLPKNASGKIEVFKLKLTETVVKEAVRKPNNQNLPAQPAAKTNVTP